MSLIIEPNHNIFKTKLTTLGSFVVLLLTIAVLSLLERILYDLARFFAVPPVDYFDNISVIIMHAGVIILFLAIALIVNLAIGPRKEKYAIALIPYFAVSIILALQLIFQISVYFYSHHTDFQFYVVMSALILFSTGGVYYIQDKHVIETP